MASLPGANNTLSAGAAASVSGDDLLVLIAPVATSADAVPRMFGSASALYAQHGYSEAVEYAALHAAQTKLPFLFVGIPIATLGAVSRHDTSGNTGTSVSTITAGGDGVLAEHDGVIKVVTGGTIGTDQIILDLSMDGGLSFQRVRLGTASSYVIPYFNVTVSFAGGTLIAGTTIHTWHGSGPLANASGWSDAYEALAAMQLTARSALVCGDLLTDTECTALTTLANSYDSSSGRYMYFRAGVLDRLPLATLSAGVHRMSASNVTFAEVGATGDTIVRATGSFASDGFATGDILTISGSASNNKTCATKATLTNATTFTLDTDDLVAEGPVANVSIVGEASLTFAAASDTIVRAGGSCGSWLDDGFRVGSVVTITGTASNNVTLTATAVTATTLTFASGLTDEVIGITVPTIVAGQTKAAWMAAITTEFAPVDAQMYANLSAGKGRVLSPFSKWFLRWPASWAMTLREYKHDLHTCVWRKSDGPTGWILDSDEYDDRVDGEAASASRFGSFRTWANGPAGAYIANSLSRAADGSLLSQTHNLAVVNRARAVCQAATEDVVGRSLILKSDGTATADSLAEINAYVQDALARDLLSNKRSEGPRCSAVTWVAATDDVLNVAEPILNGVLTINIRGTIHTVNTLTEVK